MGLLALVKSLPSDEEVEAFSKTDEVKELLNTTIKNRTVLLQLKAQQLLDNGHVMDAWKVLLM
ncbi:hypothetical protein D3C87_1668040 [compost metagenome]